MDKSTSPSAEWTPQDYNVHYALIKTINLPTYHQQLRQFNNWNAGMPDSERESQWMLWLNAFVESLDDE